MNKIKNDWEALLRVSEYFYFYVRETSPGKNDNFHLMWSLHLLCGVRVVLDFALYGKLVRPMSASV